MELIDRIPLWAFFAIVTGVALLCVEAGFLQGNRVRAKSSGDSEAPIGAMVSAVLALLAFLLTFTFGIAASRFDERRTLVSQEANAIGTTYLRADFIDEPGKSHVRNLLCDYVALRITAVDHLDKVDEYILKAEELQAKLWPEAVALASKRPTPISALFISALNDVIDLQAKRVTLSLHTRVPQAVWTCLLLVSALAMAGVGYYCGRSGTRAWAEIVIMVLTFGTVLMLVADLDRPFQGLLRVNQQPMIDLGRQIGAK